MGLKTVNHQAMLVWLALATFLLFKILISFDVLNVFSKTFWNSGYKHCSIQMQTLATFKTVLWEQIELLEGYFRHTQHESCSKHFAFLNLCQRFKIRKLKFMVPYFPGLKSKVSFFIVAVLCGNSGFFSVLARLCAPSSPWPSWRLKFSKDFRPPFKL